VSLSGHTLDSLLEGRKRFIGGRIFLQPMGLTDVRLPIGHAVSAVARICGYAIIQLGYIRLLGMCFLVCGD